MLEAVESIGGDSAILYFRWLTDVEGNSFIPEEVIKNICSVTKVPVYGTAIQYLGSGILGGYLKDQRIAGQAAADTVITLLDGNRPDSYITHTLSNVYAFDWRQLQKWDIDGSQLPEGSIIEYKEVNVWQQYWGYIFGALVLLVLQTALIFALMVNKRMRKRAENKLVQSNASLKALTERLISNDKIKDEFLTNTSHELQTPLNGIINVAETLMEGNYGSLSQKQQEELKVILAVSRRMSSLINDIIDIERVKRNEIHFNFESIDISSTSAIVVDVFRHLIQGKPVDIVMDIPEGLSPALADKSRFIQILYNLLGNAMKFTEKGNITLSAEEEGNFVKVKVEDTGIGISKEVQEKIFTAFSHGGEEIQRQYGGSGLGLYVAQKLVERMSGKIELEWSEIGKGTCFTVILPKSDKIDVSSDQVILEGSEEEADARTNEDKKLKGFKVLAVDDEPTNLRVLKSILTGEGCIVLTVSKGKDAIDILSDRHDIDLVLLDVMMPGLSGYGVCRKIRERYSLYDLPVLMLTARNTPDDIAAGFEAGANDFVIKPFVAKELRARVSTLLLLKQSVQEALRNEMAFLQAQIKPHFLYNALSTIMSFCYVDGERAGELLANLSEYLQKSFNIDNTCATVSVESELELTKAYAEIEKARFGERLEVKFNIDEGLGEKRILPLTVQPLVENAIRHGLMRRISGGKVTIEVKKVEEGIEVTVEDNGIGIEETEAVLKSTLGRPKMGVGLANIKRRLMDFYGSELSLTSKKGEGTRVSFTIRE